uniref:F-box/kelch-repeat protein At1g57790-like n=1 Tax=Erigeron canadensis TaxID=72917 RepID=UPI001CB94929|nr:F-box/kelch-repeat protein At1g57790-like [Erigeron canadensis]
MIMESCAGVEYMNFRATCKQCYLAAPAVQWGNEAELKRLRDYSLVSPWLMVAETNRDIFTFIDPILGDNYYIKHSQVSSIAEDIIHCSRFGWVLFENTEYKCVVLFNPFTNDLRKLPEPDYNYLEGLCFSAPPTSPDCMVVGFTTAYGSPTQGQWLAHIHYVAREQTWYTYRLGVDLTSIRIPTFFGRDLYALCNFGDVVYYKNLGSEDYSLKIFQAKAPSNCCKSEARYYLMKCDQHLLLVIVDGFGKFVEVFKHNDSVEDYWEKIHDLGKHTIYIHGTSCICIDAHVPEMANKIYFPNQHSTNRKIVFYSLETCLFHTFDEKNIQETLWDLYRTVHQRNPLVWIEPSWS